MHIFISYQEAASLLKEKVGKDILLNYTNETTINVGYEVNINTFFFGKKSKKINIDIVIDKIDGHTLYTHYVTSVFVGDAVVGGLLGLIPVLRKSKAIETAKNNNLIIHLDEISKMKDIMKNISLHSISFDENSINIELSPVL